MVSHWIKKGLADAYVSIRDGDWAKSEKDREILACYTLVGEAISAYYALSKLNGMAEEPLERFIDKYCWDENERHRYRTYLLLSKVEDEKYKRFKELVMEFEKARKKLKENDFQALNHLETLFFNLLNELTYI